MSAAAERIGKHETQEVEFMRVVLQSHYDALAATLQPMKAARAAWYAGNTITHQFQACARTILAFEAIKCAAGEAERKLRSYLAERMVETGGVMAFAIDGFRVSLSDSASAAIVTDQALLPADVLTVPEPKPNMREIAKRLRQGIQVPGAVLSNGAAPHIVITATKGLPA